MSNEVWHGPTLRVAWLGPLGSGGGRSLGSALLASLVEAGAQVDVYHEDPQANVPADLISAAGVDVVGADTGWEWNRWYSRKPMAAFVSGLYARSRAHARLADTLVERHRSRPYDVVFQFSQFELLSLRKHLRDLPPVVVHPCTHAAGELRWHRAEARYARRSEPSWMNAVTRFVLSMRAQVQRRQARHAALIVGPSRRFNELVSADYNIPLDRCAVLRHPVDIDKFLPGVQERSPKIRLLFVSRISVRKGVELVVELSHRLTDLADCVEIRVVGDRTSWSDYRGHLADLNPRVAVYEGPIEAGSMPHEYARADVLLVPSHYEPGSLVAGEALAAGLVVVASDEVGPAEVVDASVCRVFRRGDVDALEIEIRRLVDELLEDRNRYGQAARSEAVRLFRPSHIGAQLLGVLESVAKAGVDASHV